MSAEATVLGRSFRQRSTRFLKRRLRQKTRKQRRREARRRTKAGNGLTCVPLSAWLIARGEAKPNSVHPGKAKVNAEAFAICFPRRRANREKP